MKISIIDDGTKTYRVGLQANEDEIELLQEIAQRLKLPVPERLGSEAPTILGISMEALLGYLSEKSDDYDQLDSIIYDAYFTLHTQQSPERVPTISGPVKSSSLSVTVEKSVALKIAPEQNTDIYMGALDAECKPLLAELMNTLKEGEGVLVVYKQRRGTPTDSVFDGRVSDFTGGQPWAYCAAEDGAGELHDEEPERVTEGILESAKTLERTINASRAPTALFSLPGATTVAADTDRFGVGILSKNGAPVTKIRAVVLEPLNMGLNGDLVQHELSTTLTAVHSFVQSGAENPSVRHYTWGVGAASSPSTRTGDLLVSDTIVDFRVHYDPLAQLEALKAYVYSAGVLTGDIHDSEFMEHYNAILERAQNAKGRTGPDVYTGATMALDLADLAHMACAATGLPMRSTGGEIRRPGALQDYLQESAKKWPFYGEVSMRGPSGGQVTLYRSDASGRLAIGKGKDGYQDQMNNLFNVMRDLCAFHHPDIVAQGCEKQIRPANEATHDHIQKLVHSAGVLLGTQDNDAMDNTVMHGVKLLQEHAVRMRDTRNTLLSEGVLEDAEKRMQIEKELRTLVGGLYLLRKQLDDVTSDWDASPELTQFLKRADQLVDSEKTLAIHFEQKARVFAGGALLWNETQKHADALPAIRRAAGLEITHAGSKFFTQPDKDISYVLGSQSVEMENQLFALSIDAACKASGISSAPAVITKLAGDPARIPEDVHRGLNEWANTASMTTDAYIDAMEWVRNGMNQSAIPESGRWGAAEVMCNERQVGGALTVRAKLARSCFASIGSMSDEEDFEILNPFWLDIGTFLAKEAASSRVTEIPPPGPQSFPWKGDYGDYMKAKRQGDPQVFLQENADCLAVIGAANAVVNFVEGGELDYRETCRLFLIGNGEHPGFLGLQERANPKPEIMEADIHRVHSRQNSMFKTGYVGQKDNIDWDSALYKSSQTVIMAKDSPIFIEWTQALGANQLSPDDLPYRGYRAAYLEDTVDAFLAEALVRNEQSQAECVLDIDDEDVMKQPGVQRQLSGAEFFQPAPSSDDGSQGKPGDDVTKKPDFF
jgi:hypothetical protein